MPILQLDPDTAYPTRYTGEIAYESVETGDEQRLLVGFDVPANVGTRCGIKFRLPIKEEDEGGYQWSVEGSGMLDVWSLKSTIVNGGTTWNNKPGRTTVKPQFVISVSTQNPSIHTVKRTMRDGWE